MAVDSYSFGNRRLYIIADIEKIKMNTITMILEYINKEPMNGKRLI